MNSVFAKVPEVKQELIMTICIEEFAKNGYDNASTDIITSRAGISKGILFHYFKSKKNLYLAVVKHCTRLLIDRTMEEVDRIQAVDFFDRLKAIILAKQQITLRHSQEAELVQRAMIHPPKALKEELDAFFSEHQTKYTDPFMLNDLFKTDLLASGPLREGVTPEKVFHMVMMVLSQYSAKYLQLYRTGDYTHEALQAMLIEESDDFIDMVKYGVYRK
ncbi:TetR/AcrR family transcriptional regulator [Paenibacillus rhizovicinus]|uniref:TetR/AcrR family transcriptional regulator n=1 Tax=Paenibacillus rhizovicinus TaxID=2704463 RepID=A0A6C0NZW8_9BACL|nr:TetR/AcrR family transcriptional regulator [Paenibacillus rhizovicinus]QHW31496.1 TetR/AcrR family transcriptional regulator [Paenibacillus rhizovicinus]